MSEQCSSSWLAPPEQVELTTLPSNAAPMFDQCFTLDGNGNPTNETSLTALDDDSGDPYQPMDDGDDFPPPSDDGDEPPPDSPLSPPPTEETHDPSSPLFDTDPPSEADEEEISDAAVPEAAAGVAGSTEFTESTEFPKGVSDLVQLKLCNLLHSIDAPLGAFPLIKQWAAEAQMMGHNFQEDADKKYVTYVNSLSKRLGLDYLKHKMVNVNVPWGGFVSIPVFDFEPMFLSILDDRRIRDNLLIVWADPSARPPYDPEYYDEIHSANWYARTHAAMQTRGSSAVLCGLILFIDRTFTAENDRLGCADASLVYRRKGDGPILRGATLLRWW
jgi:hypothetical protein